ncbi:MAG: hypothetical protein IH958_03665 [Chloroflexi bacterium]|nr:hypothetical protein [Chloroflexota bacterium]
MDAFITISIFLGLIVAPGLINYYVNLYYTPSGTPLASRLELLVASMTLTFAVLAIDVLALLLVSLAIGDLEDEVADLVQRGLIGYAAERPIALTGVLTAFTVACMALMALLGTLRLPSRFVR